MNRKIIIPIIGFFIIVVIAITYQSFNPLIKNFTKKYFFQSKYINQIENLNEALRLEIEGKDEHINKLSDELDQSNSFISSIPEKLGFGLFYIAKLFFGF